MQGTHGAEGDPSAHGAQSLQGAPSVGGAPGAPSAGGTDSAQETQVTAQGALQTLSEQLEPWHKSVGDPAWAQETVLRRMLRDYAKTGYGASHGAAAIAETEGIEGRESVDDAGDGPDANLGPATGGTGRRLESSLIADYRRAFPVTTYDDYKPLIDAVMAGETALLLCEGAGRLGHHPRHRRGRIQVHPHDRHDLRMRVSAGRAMMNLRGCDQAASTSSQGVNLNLNFPSVVGRVQVGDRGGRVRLQLRHLHEVRVQVHAHPLGAGPGRDRRPRRRHDQTGLGRLASNWPIEKCRSENVTLVGGVCQHRHRVRPLPARRVTAYYPKTSGRPRS